MCGFAVVISKKNKIKRCLIDIADIELKSRGPSSQTHYLGDDIYVYQSILSIQTKPKLISETVYLPNEYSILLYNGEIYDEHDFNSDTEYLQSSNLENVLSDCDGMFSVATVTKKNHQIQITAYRDIIGEKRSFYYNSSSLFILSSTPSFIYKVLKEYGKRIVIDEVSLKDYFVTRHYLSNSTGICDIQQLPPGHKLSYLNDLDIERIWSPRSYLNKEILQYTNTIHSSEYSEHIKKLLCDTLQSMQRSVSPNVQITSMVSGGIDSSLVSYFLDQIGTKVEYGVTLTFDKKDLVALNAYKLFDKLSFRQLEYNITIQEYYKAYLKCLELCCSPIHSHDFASADIMYNFISSPGILYGGGGADELFLGYKYYEKGEISEYSLPVRDTFKLSFEGDILEDYDYAFDFFSTNGYTKKDSHIKSCSFIDFFHQFPVTNLLMSDLIGSNHGIECRTPFTRKNMVTFVINSPVKFLLNKKPLCKLFHQSFGIEPFPKQGFAGYPNEIIDYLQNGLDLSYNIFGDQFLDRDVLWKYINTEFFLLNFMK